MSAHIFHIPRHDIFGAARRFLNALRIERARRHGLRQLINSDDRRVFQEIGVTPQQALWNLKHGETGRG